MKSDREHEYILTKSKPTLSQTRNTTARNKNETHRVHIRAVAFIETPRARSITVMIFNRRKRGIDGAQQRN
jgi:hypothetical protein